ncbi:MAG TPA: 2,4-dienoyl-CoA reductase, partial [Acidimicrobiales bacterium]|nr:2,4-dienoyl-CoA reductase [Acidimicrobiales bacterium]
EVTLIERRPWCGGALRVASAGAGRAPLSARGAWREEECRALGGRIRTGTRVSARQALSFAGEVVLATGGRPGDRPYAAVAGAPVVDAASLLEARLSAGPDPLKPGPVAVWDPIGGPIAVSVAELLAAEGRTVHLLTPDLIAGNELSRTGDLAPANGRLQGAGVVIGRRTLLRRVTRSRVEIEDRFSGAPGVIDVGVVVDAGYRLPDDELWRATGGRLTRVGDAVAPRGVYEAVLEGRRAALALSGAGAAAMAEAG